MRRSYHTSYCFRLIFLGLSLMILANQTDAQIKIGTNGSIIAPASLLELESNNQGLLLPRLSDTVAINALTPPNGMLIYLTKAPAVGLYVRKVTGWEYITGSLAGNANFNSLTVAGSLTAGSLSGPLTGNATSATTAITATNSLNSAVTNDITTTTVTYPTFVTTTPGNAPLRTSNTNLSYVPATGILTAKGFNGPLVGDVTGNATSSVDAQNTVNVRITNDLVTPTITYPTFVTGTSGPLPPKVSSTNLSFIPLTGELTAPTFRGALLGNASSATTASALFTPRNINGTSFDGTANITVTADASTLTGTTLKSTVVNSSLTILGTVTAGTWNGSLIAGQYGGTGVANTGKTITLGGNLTTSGANALTLTTTALTNVTLPTSGTLYGTLGGSISSSNLLGSLTDPTGNGSAVFSNGPVLSTPNIGEANATTLYGNSTAPTTGSLGTGISVPASPVLGTNIAGTVQVTSTGAIAGGAAIITIIYTVGFPLNSYPVLYPANAATAELTDTTQVFATGTNTTFLIKAGSGGLPSGTYLWNYHVIGN